MKIIIKKEMSLPELRQCLFEQINSMEDRFSVRYSKDVTLYMTLTNGFGNPVTCRDSQGVEVQSLLSRGPYVPAVAHLDLF